MKEKDDGVKAESLRREGAFNRRWRHVKDSQFVESDFFDPRDGVQMKYEMLRRVRTDGWPVARAAAAFGLSRLTFYQAQSAFEEDGLAGLLPRKRGPRGAHKLTDEVMDFIAATLSDDASARPPELARLVAERFGVAVHPRTIERRLAAAAAEKKRR
jgi:transposase